MATQLHLVATSVVALLAGGLLGVVSILLQQLVKNPLASDTTLGVGVGAQLAMMYCSMTSHQVLVDLVAAAMRVLMRSTRIAVMANSQPFPFEKVMS